ncbi:hypothetical protein RvY_10429 [Ramazzottius varieornatus]|uniref:Glucuronosyltransferase n=1 Tax=Ramazzottius varieornatus TaxID=947166 RepID=A0A1D1VKI2_RAMVA|nr:hypothetical protein RvY_10429 [Ramazzottius varieornatus]
MMPVPSRKHVVVMPLPAMGHICPLWELAKKIADEDHFEVTFVVSESKVHEMEQRKISSTSKKGNHGVRIYGLKDGLTESLDKTIDPNHLLALVKEISPAQRAFLEALPTRNQPGNPITIQGISPVDAVIVDNCFPDPIPICRKRGIAAHAFSASAAWTVLGVMTINDQTPTMSDEAFFDGTHEDLAHTKAVKSLKEWLVACHNAMSQASSICLNSFEDLEPDFVKNLKTVAPNVADTPTYFLGPLLPSVSDFAEQKTEYAANVVKWLDQQKDKSVIYVSFGSIALPSAEQIQEITKALLATKRPFIWSLEKQAQSTLPLECCKHLNNCEKQSDLADCPYLIASWQPQKEILAHPATGLFIGHCGWNSTIESIGNGVPKLALPMFGDQHENAELVEKIGCGIMIPNISQRGERLVPAEEILTNIKAITGEQDGSNGKKVNYYGNAKEYSAKAHEAISPSGKSTRDFHNFCMNL